MAQHSQNIADSHDNTRRRELLESILGNIEDSKLSPELSAEVKKEIQAMLKLIASLLDYL